MTMFLIFYLTKKGIYGELDTLTVLFHVIYVSFGPLHVMLLYPKTF